MARVLWVEDFPRQEYKSVVEKIFRNTNCYEEYPRDINNKNALRFHLAKYDISLFCDFATAIDYINKHDVRQLYEFVILDVDLKEIDESAASSLLVGLYKFVVDKYKKLCPNRVSLKSIAGYYLYLELLAKGFERSNIRFFSAHVDNLDSIRDELRERGDLPIDDLIIDKDEPQKLNSLLIKIYSTEYFMIRSAVYSHCNHVANVQYKINQLDKYTEENVREHFLITSNLLPLYSIDEICGAKIRAHYKVLASVILMLWDKSNVPGKNPRLRVYRRVLNRARNIILHGGAPNKFSNILPADIIFFLTLSSLVLCENYDEGSYRKIFNLLSKVGRKGLVCENISDLYDKYIDKIIKYVQDNPEKAKRKHFETVVINTNKEMVVTKSYGNYIDKLVGDIGKIIEEENEFDKYIGNVDIINMVYSIFFDRSINNDPIHANMRKYLLNIKSN